MYLRSTIVILLMTAFVALAGFTISNPPTFLQFEIPKGWPQPAYNVFETNPLTEEGFQLGRKIFYDANLSKDGMVSCGNCHQQFAGFATLDHDLSHGVDNGFTSRNAPSLANLAWMRAYHWDGGVHNIEVQPLTPFTHPQEMGETLENVVAKINADESYKPLFKAAFGNTKVSMARINKALAQFTCSLVSSNSKYDRVMRGEDSFDEVEWKGYALFKANCASCHKEPLFTDGSYRNNGMGLNYSKDVGRSKITGLRADSLRFKVPTLRNVQVSYPYMHDGSMMYLPNVLDHYTNIDTTSMVLDSLLRRRLPLSPKNKKEIMYFLYTLTDSSFLRNPRFAPPHEMIYIH